MAKKTAPTPAVETVVEPTRAACLCGCGGQPARPTSRFLPGHDARYHAAQKRAAAVTVPVAAPAADRPRRATKRAAGQDDTARVAPEHTDGAQ